MDALSQNWTCAGTRCVSCLSDMKEPASPEARISEQCLESMLHLKKILFLKFDSSELDNILLNPPRTLHVDKESTSR